MPRQRRRNRKRGRRLGRARGFQAVAALRRTPETPLDQVLHPLLQDAAELLQRASKPLRKLPTPLRSESKEGPPNPILGRDPEDKAHAEERLLAAEVAGPLSSPKGSAEMKVSPELKKMIRAGAAVNSFDWSEEEDSEADEVSRSVDSLALLRGVFKADQPYRTRLATSGSYTTSAAGVFNFTQSVNGISSAAEWTVIDQLFDEFFIHSLIILWEPVNMPQNPAAGAGICVAYGVTAAATTPANFANLGGAFVALFNGASTYGNYNAMVTNPTRHFFHTSKRTKFVWKNNVRFTPHGLAVGATSFQGWTLIGNVSNYGGSVQARLNGDNIIGDGTHAFTVATYTLLWDVSFRARS